MFDRRLVVNFDWVLLLTVLLLAGLGILNLFSATASWQSGTPLYMKQLVWLGGGVGIALTICLFDYRHLEYFAIHIYLISVAMLVFVLTMGKTTMGATRWIDLGFFNLQPSEVIKIAIILLFARIFSKSAGPFGYGFLELWKPALWLIIPVVLILRQPDLGTTIMVLFIAVTMLLFAGLKRGTVVILSFISILTAILAWF
jgi:rod shape determining protein RodA